MSTEQSVDPTLVEQTKQQIRSLVGEIAQLSKSDVSLDDFYGQFLTRIVSALAAAGGAVWTVGGEGQLALQYQINLQESKLAEKSEEEQIQHSRLLYRVFRDNEPALVLPRSGSGEDNKEGNPTDFLLVMGILKTEVEAMGVVEIFQRGEAGPATQKGYLRFVAQMCELAGDFLKSRQLRHFSDRQVLWTQLEEFTHAAHTSLTPRDTAYTIANEGRRLIQCDRLSVAIRKGKKCTIQAISGQDVFDARSNTVRLLEKLATAVVRSGEPVWYTGDTRDLAPQVEVAVQEYVDEAHSKTVAVLPLRRPKLSEEDDPTKREEEQPPLAALIVEQIEDSRVAPSMVQRVDVVCRHSATALANALEHQSLFLMPLWRALGKSRIVTRARTLPTTLAVAGVVVLVLAALVIWPADFRLEAKGTLEPVEHYDVFATVKGVVDKLNVEHGAQVHKGELLAQLRDTELEMSLSEIRGQREQNSGRIESLQRGLNEFRTLRPEEKNRMEGDLAEAQEKAISLTAQWELLKQKEADLQIKSPIDGEVVTWDLRNRLIYRPVQRGQPLIRVADLNGPWQLELHMPERRMGHIVEAQKEDRENLDVVFQLATDPGAEFHGEVQEISRMAEIRGEEGNTVLIKVKIDKTQLPHLRPGATVTGKVYCGRRSLAYVWLHDVLAFIQSRILFRYF